MCKACRLVGPREIEDIVAIGALYRPGPMEFIPLYAERKAGRVPVEYDHPLLEPILKETYGIIIYQEQVMQAAQVLAGYTLGNADVLRRAMGKKKAEEMAKQRAIFVAGAKEKNGINADKANQLFDVLDKFAGYGFNKAHAACYAVLTCQTAYLKARYPVQFMAALLSNELDNTDKIAVFVAEAKAMGLSILPPSVNESREVFTVKDKSIRFGLSAIKNVGGAAVKLIIAARDQAGPFADLHDLCSRVEARAMNKKLLESLVKSGACDDFGGNRAELLSQVDGALAQASAQARDRDAGQGSLLDLLGPVAKVTRKNSGAANATGIPEWPSRERLAYEKELLGFYITGHPLDEFRADLSAFQTHTAARLKEVAERTDARLCGLIIKLEIRLRQKDKQPWAQVTLEDQTGTFPINIYNEVYAALPRALNVGDVVVISGQYDPREEQPRLNASQALDLAEAHEQLLRELVLHLRLEDWAEPIRWQQLREIVMDTPGPVKLRFVCRREGRAGEIELAAADNYGVTWNLNLREKLEKFLEGARYEFRASSQIVRQKRKAWQQRN